MNRLTPAMAFSVKPILLDFQTVQGETMKGCDYVEEHGCLTTISLSFESVSLIIKADEDDDSLVYAVEPRKSQIEAQKDGCPVSWVPYLGKTFGWGWLTINQQGYCDGLLLSFDGLTPNVLLNVVASSIKVLTIGSI